MKDPASREDMVPEGNIGDTLHKRDFWSKENLKVQPTALSPRKVRTNYKQAGARQKMHASRRWLRAGSLDALSFVPNIQYYGIDIAIHDPAPNLIEADFLETPN